MHALLIGCGNIGAMYDFENDNITTHAKMYQHYNFQVDIVEPDEIKATKVIEKYGYSLVEYQKSNLGKYDYISICVPTQHHFSYLIDSLKAEVPLIICEKPVSFSLKELNELLSSYKNRKSKVLVNYMRRFQKSYKELSEQIKRSNEPLQAIYCSYYKGLLNYASHAVDIITFLTGFKLNAEEIIELKRKYDYFKFDPTITFAGQQDNVNYHFLGLGVQYPIFEIELFFPSYRVHLTCNGSTVNIYRNNNLLYQNKRALKNYMLDVMSEAEKLYHKENKNDNFEESIQLNKMLLNIIKKRE